MTVYRTAPRALLWSCLALWSVPACGETADHSTPPLEAQELGPASVNSDAGPSPQDSGVSEDAQALPSDGGGQDLSNSTDLPLDTEVAAETGDIPASSDTVQPTDLPGPDDGANTGDSSPPDDASALSCPDGQQLNAVNQCVPVFTCPPPNFPPSPQSVGLDQEFVTWVASPDLGNVAIKVRVPKMVRYLDHTAVVVNVATFFTPTKPFYEDLAATDAGLLHVSYLWPGTRENATGACSEGVYDYGGPIGIAGLRDVIRYAMGDLSDIEGLTLNDRLNTDEIQADPNNVGLWAFSHPGIAAMNVLGRHQDLLSKVAWFVGRENPTQDQHSAVELGHFGVGVLPVLNPLYSFESHYSPGEIDMDMSGAAWNPDFIEGTHPKGRAYFDLDGDGFDTDTDHTLSYRVPTMYDKRTLSRRLTHALRDNGLSPEAWPADLSTPEEADALWTYRNSVDRYPLLANSGLRALLVFAQRQHVQPLPDATSVHSAWDGLRGAGLWVRLNPDQSYADWAAPNKSLTTPDADANTEPGNWANAAAEWGHSALDGSATYGGGENAGWAAIAEMADRVEFDRWEPNLNGVLVPNFPSPPPPGQD